MAGRPPCARTASNSVSEPPPGADHEAEVAVELGHVAGDAAVVLGVDLLAGELEGRRLARLARLLLADAELGEQLLVASARLVLDVHVRVERDERAVGEAPERVDLGEDHVVLDEQPRKARDDRHELVERRAGDAGRGDHLLGLEVAQRQDVREVPSPDRLGLLLGDLLDVDAADRREDHHRLLADAVPDDARVVLLLDLRARVDEHATRHVAVDLEREDLARVGLGLLGRVGELDAAGLHAPARQHLRLDHRRATDPLRDRARLGGVGREAVVGDGDAGALDDLARLVLEESHCGAEAYMENGAAGAEVGRSAVG